MNSKLKSVGKIFLFSIGLASIPALGLAADEAEVSLKDDRRSIEELRQNIPPEIRAENDALKESLALLGEVKKSPQEHREKFDRKMREMREKKRKERQKTRQEFSKNERTKRDKFLKELKFIYGLCQKEKEGEYVECMQIITHFFTKNLFIYGIK